MWVEKTLLSIHVKLWDVKRRLLSYLEEMAVGNPVGNAESVARQVTTAVMLDLEDRDFQQNICINLSKMLIDGREIRGPNCNHAQKQMNSLLDLV